MPDISTEVGNRIRQFRRSRGMTQEALAAAVGKSKATLSKYENGTIALDLETLYALAKALRVHIEQLLPAGEPEPSGPQRRIEPAFFRGLTQFYGYFFDGRNGRLSRWVFDVFSPLDVNRSKIALYMNYSELERYQQAENIYWGYIEHFDALSVIELTHQDNPMEKGSIQVLSSFLDAEVKWALWNGVSSRPMMPVAVKVLLSKKPLKEDGELMRMLKLTKEDIRRMKYYNMFSVV